MPHSSQYALLRALVGIVVVCTYVRVFRPELVRSGTVTRSDPSFTEMIQQTSGTCPRSSTLLKSLLGLQLRHVTKSTNKKMLFKDAQPVALRE